MADCRIGLSDGPRPDNCTMAGPRLHCTALHCVALSSLVVIPIPSVAPVLPSLTVIKISGPVVHLAGNVDQMQPVKGSQIGVGGLSGAPG